MGQGVGVTAVTLLLRRTIEIRHWADHMTRVAQAAFEKVEIFSISVRIALDSACTGVQLHRKQLTMETLKRRGELKCLLNDF